MSIAIDPVCGMEVDTATSLLSFEYDGTTYWFCSKGCLLDFKDDPAAYLGSDRTPSMPGSDSVGAPPPIDSPPVDRR